MLNPFKGRLLAVRVILFTCVVTLVIIGIITIYSVENPAERAAGDAAGAGAYWKKQAVFAVAGLAAFVAVNLVSYRKLGAASAYIYAAVLLMLILLLFSKYIYELPFAPPAKGTYRWITISIGGYTLPSIQPSELCKLAFIIALAWYLRYRSNYRNLKSLIGPFVLTLLPMALIIKEPDLGTVMLMMPILFIMLFVVGARVKHLLIIVLLGLICTPVFWLGLRPYQRRRISTVLLQSQWIRDKAEQDRRFSEILIGERFTTQKWNRDWGYQLNRSKYAVASGGATGYGFGKGPFVKYRVFLPERHNDLIFAMIAHQWGFVGCVVLLGIYALIVACGLEIAANHTDPFAKLLAVGIISMFIVEVLVNVGMTVGLMPITGLTLPLVSYGGSSLVVSMTAIGLLNNLGRSRPFTVAPKT